ncbi:MAG TPA: TolC family protein [Bryobacteraceae bacterium]|nr:TolC family protein [Bryobacteraceae bacterium]
MPTLCTAIGKGLIVIAVCGSGAMKADMLTLAEAVQNAEANNRAILAAKLERSKALNQIQIARTYRLPVFSVTALGTQSASALGLTFPQGSLGVYPGVGPIPGKTTTLSDPLRPGAILLASASQPLSQQRRIGLGIELAHLGVEAAGEQIRSKRQAAANEVRRLYYGILQTESGRRSLKEAIAFLAQLDRDTGVNVAQRVALRADSLDVKARLAKAEYALLELEDPLETQKQQLNVLMGRDPDTAFEVDPLAAADFTMPELKEAYARALESRPEIRLARLQVRKAGLERRIRNAERIPDVSLSLTTLATANLISVLPNRLAIAGVQLNWDVYDWGRKRRQVDEKRLAEQQAELDLKEAVAKVKVDVAHRYRRLAQARKQLEVARLSQSAAGELLRVTRNRYDVREVLLSDVLRVQSSVAESDSGFTRALLDVATAQADFEKALGIEP